MNFRLLLKKDIFFYGIALVFIIICFNGYLNPNNTRVFGDTYPNNSFKSNNKEFFYYDFNQQLKPTYNAPYRFELDSIKVDLSKKYSAQTAQWLVTFLPFLVSCLLASFLFIEISRNKINGLLVWAFFTFSTFILFVSSIHTNIITGINLFLFYVFLYIRFYKYKAKPLDTATYLLGSAVVVSLSLIFEMRMIIVMIPFFIVQFFIFVKNKIGLTDIKKQIIHFLSTHSLLILIVLLNFLFLLLNFSVFSEQASALVTRSTWGNGFFNIVNTLSISHPFWNNSEPINFVYHFPLLIHSLNILIFALVFVILIKIPRKFKRTEFLFVIPLFFYLILSKQNNPPFVGIFDFLNNFPYFNLSREASKYFYGYILSFSFLILFALDTNLPRISRVKTLIVVLILAVTVNNFYIFSSGAFGRATVDYSESFNILAYNNINDFFEQSLGRENTRVLWLPFKPNLQNYTTKTKHFSLTSLIESYPLGNLNKNVSAYSSQSLNNPNLVKYLSILGIDYVVLPELGNEPIMGNEILLNNPNFDISRVSSELEKQGFDLIKNIDGYQVFELNHNKTTIDIVSSDVNSHYLNIGEIVLKNSSESTGLISEDDLNIVKDINYKLANCNNNSEKGLDFIPENRISLVHEDNLFNLRMSANNGEVPCVFGSFSKSNSEAVFLNIENYLGTKSELRIFNDQTAIMEAMNLMEISNGLIPLSCIRDCNFGFYLYGNNSLETTESIIRANFVSYDKKVIESISDKVANIDIPINELSSTIIKMNDELINAEYIVFPYFYAQGYRLIIDDSKEIVPSINNHNLLIFENFDFKLNPLSKIELLYLPELNIKPELKLTRIINISTVSIFVILLCFKTIRAYAMKRKSNSLNTHENN